MRKYIALTFLVLLAGCGGAPAPAAAPPTALPSVAATLAGVATATPSPPAAGPTLALAQPTINLTPVASPTVAPSPAAAATSIPAPTPIMRRTTVSFQSGDLTLAGYLYQPSSGGPFPAIVWNHGSEQYPNTGPEFAAAVQPLIAAGYVVFEPMRRGHDKSQGEYIGDQISQTLKTKGSAAAQQEFVQLMEGPQLDDQLAGQAYLKSLPFVDKDRLMVAGCSYGGIQTMLAAERGAGYKAAVAMSPGAESWAGSVPLQQRLVKAVSGVNLPVFILHPEKDASVAPGYALAQEFLRLGKPYSFKIYPPFGPDAEQGHCFGGAQGFHWWTTDVLAFLAGALAPNAASIPVPSAPVSAQKISLKSDGLTLEGYVYKPAGTGPFPGIIWNHGSEQNPMPNQEFDQIAMAFVTGGYVVVDPVRRGHGGSQGQYIDDLFRQEAQAHGHVAAEQLFIKLMETEQLDDQLAGLAYLKNLPYVDKSRLAVVGCSYGGIQTLMGAEHGVDYKAAVAMSPGAESWASNPLLQAWLVKTADSINIPVMLMHPAKDASVAPGYAIGPEFQRLGKPYGLQIFPPFGPAQQHCEIGPAGRAVWAPVALEFLRNILH